MNHQENAQNDENGTFSPSAIFFAVGTLKAVETAVFNEYGATSKPAGKTWLYMVLDMARRIADQLEPDQITPEVLEALTDDNFHTVRHAAEVILKLSKYTL